MNTIIHFFLHTQTDKLRSFIDDVRQEHPSLPLNLGNFANCYG